VIVHLLWAYRPTEQSQSSNARGFAVFPVTERESEMIHLLACQLQHFVEGVVGVLWTTILAATTDLLFVWAARIVMRWVAR
jgi:hypothetical protein